MDTIRLFHKEIGGYLTVTKRDVESHLPDYPDYLNKEVNILAEEKDDLENEEEDEIVINEGKNKQELLVYIERDNTKLDKTNTLWEIQKVDELVGETLQTNEYYLLKHIASGMYLTIKETVELGLSKSGAQPENEFKFKNSKLFNTIKSEIHDKDLVCLLNIDNKFIQTYASIEDDKFNYIQSRSHSTHIPIV